MTLKLSLSSTKPLTSGAKIPSLGFGVFQSPPEVTQASVKAALDAGYRHFDTAQYYENERETGQAILASSVPRSEIFFTTKILNPVNDSVEETYASLKASVDKSGLGYVDLFLIHTPQSGPDGRKIMWTALQKLKQDGLSKSIGVSNFGVAHLQQLEALGGEAVSVNQIELHPYCQQPSITKYCLDKGIVVEAYCPLTRGERFKDPVLVKIAESSGKSVPQVLIRWSLQRGFVPLPKSDTKSRIVSNAEVYDFELSQDDMDKIDALNEDKSIFHNPVNVD
ncbi:putative Aldo-keto reductase [Taphrina deformans PYCC 5710]|uniref:Aldo-keto reductase n=1 Tax=Taphrina deformans (strain PYCC 5710 / ATCC 11124 / CBS 356.35 / IMI 108563 / JCM 9778 / NBRC 8474) TaxID=1097556 RepID=R4X8Z0_TAPDE|nr:putative Aldo-keto reductase [Taphrina deformans PYCC 5710]|eukprot:CCG80612.1 putative Aldo-keto reductase [Taphrina deformans PYCC 5710]